MFCELERDGAIAVDQDDPSVGDRRLRVFGKFMEQSRDRALDMALSEQFRWPNVDELERNSITEQALEVNRR